jgi:hypothetical protein
VCNAWGSMGLIKYEKVLIRGIASQLRWPIINSPRPFCWERRVFVV